MNYELTTSPSEQDAKTISRGLVDFNHKTAENLEPEEKAVGFSIFARNAEAEIMGGLRATCFWNTLHVELLWVAENVRGAGTGSALLRQAEQFAVEHGFEQALTETTSWQSRPFYEKHGYELIATLPNYPKGHACHFLTKKLTNV